MTQPKACSICGGAIEAIGNWTAGNNAAPFPGRSCNDCDNRFVIPARALGIEPQSDLIPILREFARQGRIHSGMAAMIDAMRHGAECGE